MGCFVIASFKAWVTGMGDANLQPGDIALLGGLRSLQCSTQCLPPLELNPDSCLCPEGVNRVAVPIRN